MRKCFVFAVCAFAGVTASIAVAHDHHHEGDFIIGISGGANPQLKFEFDEHVLSGEEYVELMPSLNPGIPGWLGDAPGFEALESNHADEDFFMMAPGAQIRLVGLDLDSALFVRAATLGSPVRISPSPVLGYLSLGDHELHTHGIWHIDSSATGFDPLQATWSGAFKFVDVGTTAYADSDPFTIQFIPVPEPASIGLMLVAGLMLARVRRWNTVCR
jgi:hypothetical protein